MSPGHHRHGLAQLADQLPGHLQPRPQPAASGKRGEDSMRPNDQQTCLSRRRAGRLSATGLVLSVLGAGLSGLLVTDFFDLALARQLPLGTAARVSDAAKQLPLGAVLAKPTAIAAIIVLVLLVLAAWRAGWIPWWPALVVFAGWVLAFSGTAPGFRAWRRDRRHGDWPRSASAGVRSASAHSACSRSRAIPCSGQRCPIRCERSSSPPAQVYPQAKQA